MKEYSERLDYAIEELVPLISWVQAGTWGEAIDDYMAGDAESWLLCPVKHSKHTYALKVIGDSMTSPYPGGSSYPEGTFIYVDPEREPVNGSKVIAKVMNKNEVTFNGK